MNMKRRFLNLLLLSLATGTIAAQNAEENTKSSNIASRESNSTLSIVNYLPKVTGFINVRYQYDGEDDANGFDARRARLDFKGDIGSNFDYRLQVDFASSPKILDAYLRYKFDPRLNLQAGEFKIPFSMENYYYGPTSLETADNSLVVSKLSNYSDVSGIKANGRDIGVSLYGGFFKRKGYNVLDYSIGVFNGSGINTQDTNKSKDFSGLISVKPSRDLTFSGYYYNGSYGSEGDTHSRERVGGGLRWDDRKLLIRSEYIYGKTGGIESEGVYAIAGYYFVPNKFQFLLKYDYFQEDKKNNDTRENDYTAGINFFPKKNLRLQANYTYKNLSSGDDYGYFAVQFFASF